MNTKTMEGLVGASTNMNLVNTPMRVFKEARRKGDTEAMERAMGYAGEFADKAQEYKTKADEGMKEEAKEARERKKLEREKAIEKRKEEREKLEGRIEESKDAKADTVEISDEGKIRLKDTVVSDEAVTSSEAGKLDAGKEPVIYTKTGEVSQQEQNNSISISV